MAFNALDQISPFITLWIKVHKDNIYCKILNFNNTTSPTSSIMAISKLLYQKSLKLIVKKSEIFQ